jgi:hypothetical protein
VPQFRIQVIVQCGPPDVTPDVENGLVELPRRMLFTPPRFLGELLTRAASTVEVQGGTSEASLLALAAAKTVLPAGYGLDIVPQAYAHREVDGTYMASGPGSYVFIVGEARTGAVVPFTSQQSHELSSDGTTLDTGPRRVDVEFRCHLLVTAL